MKKILSLAMICLLIVAFTAMAVVPAAATNETADTVSAESRELIISVLKEHVPSEILNKHLPTVENVLNQLTITKEQADDVVECIKAADSAVEDHHDSLSEFTEDERVAVMHQVDKACEILKTNYELKLSESPKHEGDQVAIFYKEDGAKLAEVDFDAVKKTNTPSDVNVELVVLAVVFLAGAIVTATLAKKALSAR